MTLLKQILNLIFGLSVTVLVIGGIMFLALKSADFINKKDGENKY
jgi:hypothetical protein